MSKNPKFIVDCADHDGFVRLANGQKTVMTRANKSSQQNEDYTEANKGDVLELVDVRSGDRVQVMIESASFYTTLSELYSSSKIADETFDKHFNNEDELRAEYENNRPSYTKILDKNGIVVWRVKLLQSVHDLFYSPR